MKSMFAVELARHRNRAWIAGGAFVVLLALGIALSSCRKHDAAETASSSGSVTVAVPAVQTGAPSSVRATRPGGRSEDVIIGSTESVPPEVSVWASDTLVAP